MDPSRLDQVHAFVKVVWPSITESHFRSTRDQYSRLSETLDQDMKDIDQNSNLFSLHSSKDMLNLVQELRKLGADESTSEAYSHCLCALHQNCCPPGSYLNDERLPRTLRYAMKIWLNISLQPRSDPHKTLSWDPQQRLQDVVAPLFGQDQILQAFSQSVHQNLSEKLTASILIEKYGFHIVWTDTLTQHLSIDWKQKILTVYEHKIVAYNHLTFDKESLPVPHQLLEEVIDTLNLLFPFGDGPTKKLLAKNGIPFYGLGSCGRQRKTSVDEFHYWREPIGRLNEMTEGPSPVDEESRNLISRFNFWIALAVGGVTVVALAIAVVALVYSIKQYQLDLKQYELSVAQACLDATVRRLVPHICIG